MKIKSVTYKNCRNIKDLEVDVQGKNILLIGDNGVGKSNAIKFILSALGLMNPGKDPITDGEAYGQAKVIADKNGNEYTFTLKMKQGKDPVVECVYPDGMKETRKSILGQITGGELPFDIDAFVEMSSSTAGRRKQVDVVKTFFPKDIQEQIALQEAKVKKLFDERTEIGRKHRMYKEKVETADFDGMAKYAQPLDITKLNGEYRKIADHNASIDRIIASNKSKEEKKNSIKLSKDRASNTLKDSIANKNEEIASLEKRIETLKQQIKDDQAKTKQYITEQDKLLKDIAIEQVPERQSDAEILEKLNSAQYHNEQHLKYKQFKDDIKLRDELEEQVGEMSVQIDVTREAIHDTIREIGLPVDGLTFDSDQLYWHGRTVDSENLSTSEIMELGCRLRLARNPEFGVLLIERGESIGSKRWKEIQQMCKKYDWHIIAEKVDTEVEKLTVKMMKEL